MMKKLLFAVILCGPFPLAVGQDSPATLNLGSDSLTFCMSGNCSALPETSLFSDPVNNSIGIACINHVRLSRLHIADLDSRVDALTKGNTIVVRNGRCSLTFPAIVGSRRQQLRKISEDAAVKLRPKVLGMIRELHAAVPGRPEMVFHLLWSRVMDEVWDKAWEASFGKRPLPDATWAVFPQHPFTIGTYFYPLPGNDTLSLTQSSNSHKYKSKVVSLAADLHLLAWKRKVPSHDEAELRELGMLDSEMNFHVLTYHQADAFDHLLEQLVSEYATSLAGVYDYKGFAKSFGISPTHLFYMLLHETAYAVLDDLRRSGDLQVPAIIVDSADSKKLVEVVSIKTAASE